MTPANPILTYIKWGLWGRVCLLHGLVKGIKGGKYLSQECFLHESIDEIQTTIRGP